LEAKINEHGVVDPEAMYKIAQAYASIGDKASALRVLRHSIENGFFPYLYVAADPLSIRFVAKGNFLSLWMRHANAMKGSRADSSKCVCLEYVVGAHGAKLTRWNQRKSMSCAVATRTVGAFLVYQLAKNPDSLTELEAHAIAHIAMVHAEPGRLRLED
jgi:hypothetical protein